MIRSLRMTPAVRQRVRFVSTSQGLQLNPRPQMSGTRGNFTALPVSDGGFSMMMRRKSTLKKAPAPALPAPLKDPGKALAPAMRRDVKKLFKPAVVPGARTTVIVTSWKRAANVKAIFDAFRAQTTPVNLVCWDNGRSAAVRRLAWDRYVASPQNYLSMARWEVAKLADTEYVMIFDDDLTPQRAAFVQQAQKWMDANPDVAAIGSEGVIFRPEAPYREHTHLTAVERDTRVDFLKGRMICCRRELLAGHEATSREDDIEVCAHLRKAGALMLPRFLERELRDLPSGKEALSAAADHLQHRTAATQRFFPEFFRSHGYFYTCLVTPGQSYAYAEMAHQSILSLRRSGNAEPVCVATNVPDKFAGLPGVEVLPLTAKTSGGYDTRPGKLAMLELSPFQRTVFLDCDTTVKKSLAPLFQVLDTSDLAAVLNDADTVGKSITSNRRYNEVQYRADWDFTRAVCGADFAQHNTGVLAFRKTESLQRFFEVWQQEWHRYQRMDQTAFMRARKATGQKVRTLPSAYNHTTYMPPDPQVRIQHHTSTKESLAAGKQPLGRG